MMNVLLLPSQFPTEEYPDRATYLYDQALCVARGHQVTVAYAEPVPRVRRGEPLQATTSTLPPAPRLRLFHYGYRPIPRCGLLSSLLAYSRVVRTLHREAPFDLIFAHIVSPAGLAAVLLGRRMEIPVLLAEHWGPARSWMGWPPYFRPRFPRLIRGMLAFTYRSVQYLGAVSGCLAREIEEVFRATVHGRFYNAVDCSLFSPAPYPAAVKRVLCVTRGGADPRKGLPNLLSAWQQAAARAGGAILDVVGPKLEEVRPLVEEKGIGSSCRLHPWMPTAEVAEQVRRASLVVIPSTYETFNRTGAEALACGVPVVATRCGGPEEYVQPGTGLLVPTEDPEALAQGILEGLERDRFLPPAELASIARERFSYEAVGRHFTEVAERIRTTRSEKGETKREC